MNDSILKESMQLTANNVRLILTEKVTADITYKYDIKRDLLIFTLTNPRVNEPFTYRVRSFSTIIYHGGNSRMIADSIMRKYTFYVKRLFFK